MIVVPVEPTSRPKSFSSPRPIAPPWSFPSVASRPKLVTSNPVRNGRTSTSALRPTIKAPMRTKATGATYAAVPMAPVKASAMPPPTIPPLQPR